jgi:threonine dehydrogenase-like Zn-dependent dehydrogenase
VRVIGSFMASDGTCEICRAGYQSRCAHVEYVGAGGAQAEYLRVPLADGTQESMLQPSARPAPVRRFLPDLIGRIESGVIDPGKVFDLTLPLGRAAEGYRAMDERRAIKTLLHP